MKYIIYIGIYGDSEKRFYWNSFLSEWITYRGNATPFSLGEIESLIKAFNGNIHFPFNIKFELE